MLANKTLLQRKYARVIAAFAQKRNLTFEEALKFFYHSITYDEMRLGIADMHCRSDQYLADELIIEYDDLSY